MTRLGSVLKILSESTPNPGLRENGEGSDAPNITSFGH